MGQTARHCRAQLRASIRTGAAAGCSGCVLCEPCLRRLPRYPALIKLIYVRTARRARYCRFVHNCVFVLAREPLRQNGPLAFLLSRTASPIISVSLRVCFRRLIYR